MAKLCEKKAMQAAPKDKQGWWNKAFELEQQAATRELELISPQQNNSSYQPKKPRPPGI